MSQREKKIQTYLEKKPSTMLDMLMQPAILIDSIKDDIVQSQYISYNHYELLGKRFQESDISEIQFLILVCLHEEYIMNEDFKTNCPFLRKYLEIEKFKSTWIDTFCGEDKKVEEKLFQNIKKLVNNFSKFQKNWVLVCCVYYMGKTEKQIENIEITTEEDQSYLRIKLKNQENPEVVPMLDDHSLLDEELPDTFDTQVANFLLKLEIVLIHAIRDQNQKFIDFIKSNPELTFIHERIFLSMLFSDMNEVEDEKGVMSYNIEEAQSDETIFRTKGILEWMEEISKTETQLFIKNLIQSLQTFQHHYLKRADSKKHFRLVKACLYHISFKYNKMIPIDFFLGNWDYEDLQFHFVRDIFYSILDKTESRYVELYPYCSYVLDSKWNLGMIVGKYKIITLKKIIMVAASFPQMSWSSEFDFFGDIRSDDFEKQFLVILIINEFRVPKLKNQLRLMMENILLTPNLSEDTSNQEILHYLWDNFRSLIVELLFDFVFKSKKLELEKANNICSSFTTEDWSQINVSPKVENKSLIFITNIFPMQSEEKIIETFETLHLSSSSKLINKMSNYVSKFIITDLQEIYFGIKVSEPNSEFYNNLEWKFVVYFETYFFNSDMLQRYTLNSITKQFFGISKSNLDEEEFTKKMRFVNCFVIFLYIQSNFEKWSQLDLRIDNFVNNLEKVYKSYEQSPLQNIPKSTLDFSIQGYLKKAASNDEAFKNLIVLTNKLRSKNLYVLYDHLENLFKIQKLSKEQNGVDQSMIFNRVREEVSNLTDKEDILNCLGLITKHCIESQETQTKEFHKEIENFDSLFVEKIMDLKKQTLTSQDSERIDQIEQLWKNGINPAWGKVIKQIEITYSNDLNLTKAISKLFQSKMGEINIDENSKAKVVKAMNSYNGKEEGAEAYQRFVASLDQKQIRYMVVEIVYNRIHLKKDIQNIYKKSVNRSGDGSYIKKVVNESYILGEMALSFLSSRENFEDSDKTVMINIFSWLSIITFFCHFPFNESKLNVNYYYQCLKTPTQMHMFSKMVKELIKSTPNMRIFTTDSPIIVKLLAKLHCLKISNDNLTLDTIAVIDSLFADFRIRHDDIEEYFENYDIDKFKKTDLFMISQNAKDALMNKQVTKHQQMVEKLQSLTPSFKSFEYLIETPYSQIMTNIVDEIVRKNLMPRGGIEEMEYQNYREINFDKDLDVTLNMHMTSIVEMCLNTANEIISNDHPKLQPLPGQSASQQAETIEKAIIELGTRLTVGYVYGTYYHFFMSKIYDQLGDTLSSFIGNDPSSIVTWIMLFQEYISRYLLDCIELMVMSFIQTKVKKSLFRYDDSYCYKYKKVKEIKRELIKSDSINNGNFETLYFQHIFENVQISLDENRLTYQDFIAQKYDNSKWIESAKEIDSHFSWNYLSFLFYDVPFEWGYNYEEIPVERTLHEDTCLILRSKDPKLLNYEAYIQTCIAYLFNNWNSESKEYPLFRKIIGHLMILKTHDSSKGMTILDSVYMNLRKNKEADLGLIRYLSFFDLISWNMLTFKFERDLDGQKLDMFLENFKKNPGSNRSHVSSQLLIDFEMIENTPTKPITKLNKQKIKEFHDLLFASEKETYNMLNASRDQQISDKHPLLIYLKLQIIDISFEYFNSPILLFGQKLAEELFISFSVSCLSDRLNSKLRKFINKHLNNETTRKEITYYDRHTNRVFIIQETDLTLVFFYFLEIVYQQIQMNRKMINNLDDLDSLDPTCLFCCFESIMMTICNNYYFHLLFECYLDALRLFINYYLLKLWKHPQFVTILQEIFQRMLNTIDKQTERNNSKKIWMFSKLLEFCLFMNPLSYPQFSAVWLLIFKSNFILFFVKLKPAFWTTLDFQIYSDFIQNYSENLKIFFECCSKPLEKSDNELPSTVKDYCFIKEDAVTLPEKLSKLVNCVENHCIYHVLTLNSGENFDKLITAKFCRLKEKRGMPIEREMRRNNLYSELKNIQASKFFNIMISKIGVSQLMNLFDQNCGQSVNIFKPFEHVSPTDFEKILEKELYVYNLKMFHRIFAR
jgi:hypothetical protein